MPPDPTATLPADALADARFLAQKLAHLHDDVIPDYARHINLLVRLQSGLIAVSDWWADALAAMPWRPAPDHPASDLLHREQRRRESNLRELRNRTTTGNMLLLTLTVPDAAGAAPAVADPTLAATVARLFGDSDRDLAVLPRDLVRLNHFFRQKTQRLASNLLTPYLHSVVLALTQPLWEHKESLEGAICRGECADVPGDWLDLRSDLWVTWETHLKDAALILDIPPRGTAVDYDRHDVVEIVPLADRRYFGPGQIYDLRLPGLRWAENNRLLAAAKVVATAGNAMPPAPAPILPTVAALHPSPAPSAPSSPALPVSPPARTDPSAVAADTPRAPLPTGSASQPAPVAMPGLPPVSPVSSLRPYYAANDDLPPDSRAVEGAPPYLPPAHPKSDNTWHPSDVPATALPPPQPDQRPANKPAHSYGSPDPRSTEH